MHVLFGNLIFLKISENWKLFKEGLLDCQPNLAHLTYSDRLKYLNLPSLYYTRLRMDMIITYKILHRLVDIPIDEFFNTTLAIQDRMD